MVRPLLVSSPCLSTLYMYMCNYLSSIHFCRLIVGIKSQPTQLVLHLLECLKLSRPFVVYHAHKEPLTDLFVRLRERGGVLNLRLSESWFRPMQVRTRPQLLVVFIVAVFIVYVNRYELSVNWCMHCIGSMSIAVTCITIVN